MSAAPENGYRLNIFVGDGDEPITVNERDGLDFHLNYDSLRNGANGFSDTDDAAAARKHNLSLPIANFQQRGLEADQKNSGTPTSETRNNGGSSTPRLRISTPRSTPHMDAAGSAFVTNGRDQNSTMAKSQDDLNKKDAKLRSGPSSRRTVLIIAGLFVVGLILILAGIIVLSIEDHTAFRVAGGIFLGLGLVFFIICLILQKKNVKKLVGELEKDLYFLNVTENKIWNMIFHFDEQLVWS